MYKTSNISRGKSITVPSIFSGIVIYKRTFCTSLFIHAFVFGNHGNMYGSQAVEKRGSKPQHMGPVRVELVYNIN